MSRKKAIFFLIIAATLWSTGGVLIKNINQNAFVISGVRSGIAVLVIFLFMRMSKIELSFSKIKTLGSVMYMFMVILYIIASKMTSPANAILLQFTAPIWVAILAKYTLQEEIKKSDYLAILAVIVGLLIFFMQSLSFTKILGNFLAILSGIALASLLICLKKVKKGSAVEVTFLGNIITFIVCLPYITKATVVTYDVIYLLILGVFQLGISYVLYAKAVSYVSAVEVILITMIEPILNPLWLLILTGENMSIQAIIGGAIVIFSVITRALISSRKKSKI